MARGMKAIREISAEIFEPRDRNRMNYLSQSERCRTADIFKAINEMERRRDDKILRSPL